MRHLIRVIFIFVLLPTNPIASSVFAAPRLQTTWTPAEFNGFAKELNRHLPNLYATPKTDMRARAQYMERLGYKPDGTNSVPQITARIVLTLFVTNPQIEIPNAVADAVETSDHENPHLARAAASLRQLAILVDSIPKDALLNFDDSLLLHRFMNLAAHENPGVFETALNHIFERSANYNKTIDGIPESDLVGEVRDLAAQHGKSDLDVAQAILNSESIQDAAHRLRQLQVWPAHIPPIGQNPGVDRWASLHLHNLWRAVASNSSPSGWRQFSWDETHPMPAISLAFRGIDFRIYPHAHHKYGWSRWLVHDLLAKLRQEGRHLYSEEVFPKLQAYAQGIEMLDHRAGGGELILNPAVDSI